MNQDNKPSAEHPSRSAKKRESTALQKLGEELTALSPAARELLDLPEELLDALKMHDKITDREGARRQRQFIGKIMRSIDAEGIRQKLELQKNLKAAQNAAFQAAEKWREQLLNADAANFAQVLSRLENSGADGKKELLEKIDALARQGREEKAKFGAAARGTGRNLFRAISSFLS